MRVTSEVSREGGGGGNARAAAGRERRERLVSEDQRVKMLPHVVERATAGACSLSRAWLTAKGFVSAERSLAAKATPSMPVDLAFLRIVTPTSPVTDQSTSRGQI
jgi:hypothetical protein